VLVYENLTQNLELVQYLARPTNHASERIFGKVHLHFGATRQQVGQSRQE
jgi:hypothetical protein